jgi:hypothetical protein
MVKKNFVGEKENNEEKLKFNFEKIYFSNLNQQMSKLKSSFSLKTSKICIYYIKILKICIYMHLFKKWSKYAFAYASMQMHNYPKPTYHI